MTQWVKVPAAKSDNLSLIQSPGPKQLKVRTKFYKLSFAPIGTLWHRCKTLCEHTYR